MPVFSFTTTEQERGCRLDTVIAARYPTLSRSYLGGLIRAGHVTVNGLVKKTGYITRYGDIVRCEYPPPEPITCRPEPIPLSVLYEDADLIVLDKPAGLVVHPGPGHQRGTLVNALLHHCADIASVGDDLRPGIVHRLDKNTSGTMVAAKNDMSCEDLARQFKDRGVEKRYLALVYGKTKVSDGVIRLPIGRHPANRKKMSPKGRQGRSTETLWRVKEAFQGVTLLEVDLKTGRTHQIRVHCAAMGHPVVGDATYAGRRRWKELPSQDVQDVLRHVRRQMLHARRLAFKHPRTGQWMRFESPLPQDMGSVLAFLRGLDSPQD